MNRDFLDVIYARRSVRKFTGEKVKKDDLMAILRAGMSAPSGRECSALGLCRCYGQGHTG